MIIRADLVIEKISILTNKNSINYPKLNCFVSKQLYYYLNENYNYSDSNYTKHLKEELKSKMLGEIYGELRKKFLDLFLYIPEIHFSNYEAHNKYENKIKEFLALFPK